MRTWNEEDLILHHYGEHPESAELDAAMDGSPELRARFEELSRMLALVELPAPSRPADYGERVWQRLEPRLGVWPARSSPRWAWLSTPLHPVRIGRPAVWALAATLVLAVTAAYLVGRGSGPGPIVEQEAEAGLPPEARERILLAAVAHHLEQSEVLLVGIANRGAEPAADLAIERTRAEDLLSANRLYRSAAREAGANGLVPLLDDLEPVFLELAHAPVAAADLTGLQERLRTRDLLFKLRIVETRLRQELLPVGRPAAGPRPTVGAQA